MALQYMRFSGLLGVPSGTPRRSLPSPADARAFAETFKQRHGTPLLVNLGASKPDKLWPVASFRDLLDSLREGLDVSPWDSIVLTGGPGDRATARELMDSSGPVIDLVGSTSLPELWELCRASHAMVTADTGPMHLCAAVGTPVVAIFGPGDPARTGPFGEGHIVLHGDQRLPFSGPSVDPGPARVDAPMGATRAATVLSSLSGH